MLECKAMDNLAYTYDGSFEGLLTCVFDVYQNKENPIDIVREVDFAPRLLQDSKFIDTNISKAKRVKNMLVRQCGYEVYRNVLKVSLSSEKDAGRQVLNYIDYLLNLIKRSKCVDCKLYRSCNHRNAPHKDKCFVFKRRQVLDNISHPSVLPVFSMVRSVDNECEAMRQFARFEHLDLGDVDLWFARINPKHSVIPLIMSHFVERFNVQPFVIFDENHNLAGVYEGGNWFLVDANEDMISENSKRKSKEEKLIQEAWRSFYSAISIDSRYNPELRRSFMPKRFWKNLTEMKASSDSILRSV